MAMSELFLSFCKKSRAAMGLSPTVFSFPYEILVHPLPADPTAATGLSSANVYIHSIPRQALILLLQPVGPEQIPRLE